MHFRRKKHAFTPCLYFIRSISSSIKFTPKVYHILDEINFLSRRSVVNVVVVLRLFPTLLSEKAHSEPDFVKFFRRPRSDSKEPIPLGCVAWRRYGTTTLFPMAPIECLKIPALHWNFRTISGD